jgi:hypothetical protein
MKFVNKLRIWMEKLLEIYVVNSLHYEMGLVLFANDSFYDGNGIIPFPQINTALNIDF